MILIKPGMVVQAVISGRGRWRQEHREVKPDSVNLRSAPRSNVALGGNQTKQTIRRKQASNRGKETDEETVARLFQIA